MSEFHPSFWAALTGWFLAQLIKMISCFLRSGKLDFSYLMSTGGMPSAHTSMVCSLATSIGLHEGFSTPLFAIVVCFASVVMFDAQSVRKAAGEQAKLLNQIVDELLHEHHLQQLAGGGRRPTARKGEALLEEALASHRRRCVV